MESIAAAAVHHTAKSRRILETDFAVLSMVLMQCSGQACLELFIVLINTVKKKVL